MNRRLIEAIDRAIEALSDVKKELEKEDMYTDDEKPVETSGEIPAEMPARVTSSATQEDKTEVEAVKRPVTTRLMSQAALIAEQYCSAWRQNDGAGETLDAAAIEYAAIEQDATIQIDRNDSESFYMISPEGAIGLTKDGGETVDWLFVPADELPKEEPVQPAEPVQQAGAVCRFCGKSINPGTKFCRACGKPVQEQGNTDNAVQIKAAFCRGCGAPIKPDTRFCKECGMKL